MAEDRKHSRFKKAAWALGALLLLVVLLPLALYIPWVQNVAKDYACEWAGRKTGMDISVGRVLIKFPLDVSVDDVVVLDQNGDTVIAAGNLTAGIAFKPLLEKRIEVDEARLTDGRYRLEADDGSLRLKAWVKQCRVRGIDVDLNNNTVNVADGALRGGDVDLEYLPYKVEQDSDTTQNAPWRVKAGRLTLDDVTYSMQMLPTIDKMRAYVGHAELKDGAVDTGARTVNAGYLTADSVDCRYYYPGADSARNFAARHPVPVSAKLPADTVPWQVAADSVRLTRGHAVYAQDGARPAVADALDMDYVEVSDVNVSLDNFESRGTSVDFSIAGVSGRERSGLEIKQGSGSVSLDSAHVDLRQVRVKTMLSDIGLDGNVDMDLLRGDKNGQMHVTTNSQIALQEVGKVMPSLRATLNDVPQVSPVSLKGDVSGTMRRLQINSLTADMPRYAHATVSGVVNNPLDPDRLSGEIELDGRFDNINWIKPTLMDKATQKQVNLPPMAIKGKARLAGNTVGADATMTLAGGKVVGKGTFDSKNKDYNVDARFDHFPVKSVLPLAGVDDLTAHIQAQGHGFDFLKPDARVNASIDLASSGYNNAIYRNLKARVNLNGGNFEGNLSSNNKNCDVNVDVTGNMSGNRYTFDANGRVNELDLRALNIYQGNCAGSGRFAAHGSVAPHAGDYDVNVDLTDLDWRLDDARLVADHTQASFRSTAAGGTLATLDNEDNHLRFESPEGVEQLAGRFGQSADIVMEQWQRRALNIDTFKQALPPFALDVRLGRDGLVQRYLEDRYEADFRDVSIDMRNDSNLYVNALAHSISVGGTNIDTLTFKASEWNKYLAFEGHMGNRRGTMDEWAQVTVKGGIKGPVLDFLLTQQNIDRNMGYRLGCNATLTDTAVNMRLFPSNPVVGYRQWAVNEGNFVNYNYTNRMLDANLILQSGDSRVALTTKRQNGTGKEDVYLDIADLRIEEWTNLVPSLKSMSGNLSADFDLVYDGTNMEGTGEAELNNFVYDGRREGDFKLVTDYAIDPATVTTRLNADLLVDGTHVAVARGTLNDSSSRNPINLTLDLDRFPLRKASAFIPGKLIRLRGYANGRLTVKGNTDNLAVNGYVAGDSAYVNLPRYGSSLQLPSSRIAVRNSIIDLDNYQIKGLNDRPVTVDGTVDLRRLSAPQVNLTLRGRNVQFIGTEQKRYSQIFGKAFADLDGSVTSRDNAINVRADVTLLSGSNITYVMQDDVTALAGQTDEDMVTFVNFNDSTDTGYIIKTAAGGSLATSILANIDIQQGSKINVFLSDDGKDRATIDGSGALKYSLDFTGKDALNGTYVIESGNVRYSPPLISQKNFDIASGGTVTWTGDMLNPQLNLTGTQKLKTGVSDDDGSRLVEFVTTARLGGTLNNLNLTFDLASESDLAVQNELQSMSDVQRSQAAINLLLYNSYSGTKSVGKIDGINASNALFSFLQSQLNGWAASTLKGIDLSFGINQYEGARSGGTETSYSYRLAKSLFNDRFKIVVGGEYSTDATSDEIGQNLISDISMEYYLNNAGNRYLRLFRHAGYESVLEGHVVETGVGFVMKHKVGSLSDIFKRGRTPGQKALQDSINAQRKAEKQAQRDVEEAIAAAREQARDTTVADSPSAVIKTEDDDD